MKKLIKLITFGRLDIEKIDGMEVDELEEYVRGEWIKVWVNWSYIFNYLSMSNYWQYILVMYTV
jgi:hypothetical protein